MIVLELLESARIDEELPAFPEASRVADIDVVTGKCQLNCREGNDSGAVRIRNNEGILAVHAANPAIRAFSFVTGQVGDECLSGITRYMLLLFAHPLFNIIYIMRNYIRAGSRLQFRRYYGFSCP